jgi:hypothetical protein
MEVPDIHLGFIPSRFPRQSELEATRKLVAPNPIRFEGLAGGLPSNYAHFAALQQTMP